MRKWNSRRDGRRSQSEVIGVVLLTGIIVLVVGSASVIATSNFMEQSEEAELATSLRVDVTADNITVAHNGGDVLDESSLTLIARTSTAERRYAFATDGLIEPPDGDGTFEPGEEFVFSHSLNGAATIRVVETEQSILIDETEAVVPSDGTRDEANFAVRIDNTNSPIAEGEKLDVRPTVTNTGDRRGTQTVELAISGRGVVDSQELTLAGGESEQLRLVWNTSDGDSGSYDATVRSENDSATEAVTVEGGANFRVSIDSTNSPVEEGTTLNVTATIQNTGGTPAVQNIELNVSGQSNPVDVEQLGVNDGESRNLTLQWSTAVGDAGTYDATVASDDDATTQSVTVQADQPPTIDTFRDVTAFKDNDSVVIGVLNVSDDVPGLSSVNVTVRDPDGVLIGTSNVTGLGGSTYFNRTDLTVATTGIQPNTQYSVTVIATDQSGQQTSATETTEVGGPVADANGPYTVDEGGSVTLDGSGSNTQTGNPTYDWTIISGPGDITPITDSPNATYNAPGNVDSDTEVTVNLTVEEQGTTYNDTTTVTVRNVSQSSGTAPVVDSVTVSEGSGNRINVDWQVSDNDGDLDSVSVDSVSQDSPDSDSQSTTVSGSSASGTNTYKGNNNEQYRVTVTVTDSNGNSDSETRTIQL